MDKEQNTGKSFDSVEPAGNPSVQSSASQQKPQKKPGKSKINGKIVPVLLGVFLAGACTLAIMFYVNMEDQTNKRMVAESELREMTSANRQMKKEMDELVAIKDKLQLDLKHEQEKYGTLYGQFRVMQDKNDELTAEFKEKNRLLSELKTKLSRESRNSERLNEKLDQSQREVEDIKRQLGQIRMAKEALENRMLEVSRRKSSNEVQLERIVVGDGVPTVEGPGAPHYVALGPPSSLEGQVLVVNKEFSFVVINLGEKDGLGESKILDVFRGTRFLGKVQVERIYDTMSSAVILPEYTAIEIQEGDIVKLI